MARREYLNRIEAERSRQLELPGSEGDVKNTPNEWAAIAAHYLTENVRRGGYVPDRQAFEDSMIKAAAVILAALENIPSMQALGHLRTEEPLDAKSFASALAAIAEHRGE